MNRNKVFVCLFFAIILIVLLFVGKEFPDADIYYHIAVAKLYMSHGLVHVLPWPEIGIQSIAFTDYHFLFHIFKIPFLLLPFPETTTIKVYFVLCILWTLWQLLSLFKEDKLTPLFIGSLFLLGSVLFTGRFLFGRGNILFLGFFFLSLRLFYTNKPKSLAAIAFLSVWTYSGFLLIPFFLIVQSLFSKFQKVKLINLTYAFVGILIALVLHPSSPNQWNGYFLELIVQFYPPRDIEPIAEWLPPTKEMILLGFFPGILFLAYTLFNIKFFNQKAKAYFFSFIFTLILTGASLRLFEYTWIFFVLWIFESNRLQTTNQIKIAIVLILIQFPILFAKMQDQFKATDPSLQFGVAKWIKNNIKEKTKIFLPWADYPYFVYKNPEYKYLFGLNPIYAWGKNPEVYQIQRGFFESKTNSFEKIPNAFGYTIIVVNRLYYDFCFQFLKMDKENFILKYENAKYGIFETKISTINPQNTKLKK